MYGARVRKRRFSKHLIQQRSFQPARKIYTKRGDVRLKRENRPGRAEEPKSQAHQKRELRELVIELGKGNTK